MDRSRSHVFQKIIVIIYYINQNEYNHYDISYQNTTGIEFVKIAVLRFWEPLGAPK